MAMVSDPVLIAHILQCMLIAFWYLCTFAASVTALDLPFPRVFKEAVRLSAARGKTWDGKPSALGWLKDVSVPHIWFWHFYLVGVVCNGATLCLACVPLVARAVSPGVYTRVALAGSPPQPLEATTYMACVSLLVICMLQTHLVRRLVETLCVMRYPATSRMHILAYVYGLAYYAVLSLTFMAPSTIRTALSLVFRSTHHPAASTSHEPSCTTVFCQHDTNVDYSYDGHVLETEEIVLDPVLAVSMVSSVFESVVGTLLTDPMILLGGCVVAAGQMIQFDSHRRLAGLSRTFLCTLSQSRAFESNKPINSIKVVQLYTKELRRACVLSLNHAYHCRSDDGSSSDRSRAPPDPHSSSRSEHHAKAYLSKNTLDALAPASLLQDSHHARHSSLDSLRISTGVSSSPSRCCSRGSSAGLSASYVQQQQQQQQPAAENSCPRETRREDSTFEYKLPRGGLFEWVSCPHYLGEVVVYGGFVMMHGGRTLPVVVFLWVVLNLSIAAQDTHSWYRANFKEYPRRRKALLPLLW